jgi:molecular chaperone GrpE
MSEEKDLQTGGEQDPKEALETGERDPESEPSSEIDSRLGELQDALLRTRAEMDNLEKRTQRELEKARKFMFEGVFRDLLPVIDSLDQGLELAEQQGQSDQGLSLTRKLLLQTLERHGLEILDPEGEPFDPQWHEAMSAQPSDELAPDTILVVMQKGYRLKDRLLRPARVVISKSAAG